MKIGMNILCLVFLVSMSVFAQEIEVDIDGKRTMCTTSLYSAMTTSGGKCRFYDEVMVGIMQMDPLMVRCARIRVTCSRKSGEEEQLEESN